MTNLHNLIALLHSYRKTISAIFFHTFYMSIASHSPMFYRRNDNNNNNNNNVICFNYICKETKSMTFKGRFPVRIKFVTLTYSMVQSPSWEANWFAASQEIPRISRNQNVHYRTHKRPPPVSILGQPNPVHIPTSHLLEIHPNIIHPSMPKYPQWSPSLRFPQQDPMHPPLLTHTRYMSSPSRSSRFYHPHNIGWGVQII